MALGVDEGTVSKVEILEESKSSEDPCGGIPKYSVAGLCGTEPLGYVLLRSGKLCPFGLLPPATEADALGDPSTWVEVRVNPPSTIWTSEEPYVCPAEFCKEKMRKNYSMESHVKKHIHMILNAFIDKEIEANETPKSAGRLFASLSIKYCCIAKECGYGLSAPGETKSFSFLKYLKQHYFKVHAPKTHQCGRCDKCFSTAGFLDTHQRMCGNTFHCSSCGSSYSTLEALQTHCKRKQHTYDHTKYKDILSSFKQIQQSKKAEEHLKQKLAAVSINSSPPDSSSKKLSQLPILTPRPTTITLSVDGASTSHVAWTYEETADVIRVRKEMCTQTMTEAANEFSLCTSTQGKSSSTNNVRNSKRKKSAETQTGKVTFRISTETQTSNVTKRRRTSKKQIAEAETQCTEQVISSSASQCLDDSLNCPENWNSSNFSSDVIMEYLPSEVPSGEISIPLIMQLVGITGPPEDESTDPSSLVFTGYLEFESQPSNMIEASSNTATATIGVGNRFDEDLQELFDFNEELHQETQTDPTLFSSASVSISPDFDDFGMGESVLYNFTTAETQTLTGVSPPKIESTTYEETFPHSRSLNSHSEDWLIFVDSPGSNICEVGPSNSPNFLETMDNETQTQSPYSEYEDFFKTAIDSEPFERM